MDARSRQVAPGAHPVCWPSKAAFTAESRGLRRRNPRKRCVATAK